MQPGDLCRCHHRPSDERRSATLPKRSPCCCEDYCTCTEYYGGDLSQSPISYEKNGNKYPRRSGIPSCPPGKRTGVPTHMDSYSSRRCPVCVPEREELQDADLLALQQRCEEARLADQRRRFALSDSFAQRGHRGGVRSSYQSNTAEMLRRQRNSFYQKAVNAEYLTRRKLLQAELDARRDEIAEIQRAREERRMEVAHNDLRKARRGSCGPRSSSLQRPQSVDATVRAPPAMPPPQLREPSTTLRNQSKCCDPAASTSVQPEDERRPARAQMRSSSTPQPQKDSCRKTFPPQQHCAIACSHGPEPWADCCADARNASAPGQWHCGWIWCPHSARRGERFSSSLRQDARLPLPPPECQTQPLPCDIKSGSAQASPTTKGDVVCTADTAPTTMAERSEKSSSGLDREAVAVETIKQAQPSSPHPVTDADSGATYRVGRGRGERGRGGRPTRFHSCTASPVALAAPRFGRKVFITDDVYCARRSRYMADWEASGAVQRMPTSSRSPSAPLPEKTTKWRTTGVSSCCA